MNTLVSVSNCSFTNIKSSADAFGSIHLNAIVVIEKSSFINFTLTTFVSGIFHVYEGGNATIYIQILQAAQQQWQRLEKLRPIQS